jgi:hypothetical protein
MRTVDLGCDRTWRGVTWRVMNGIPTDSPCLGILCDRDPPSISVALLSETVLESLVEQTVQELRWMSPGLHVGVLSGPSMAGATRWNFPTQVFNIASDPSDSLDWICGVDAWLVAARSPLAAALEEFANYLQIPCFSFFAAGGFRHGSPAPGALKVRAYETALTLAESLKTDSSRNSMLAFRTPSIPPHSFSSELSVDAALGRLASVLNPASDRSPGPPSHAGFSQQEPPLRRAA